MASMRLFPYASMKYMSVYAHSNSSSEMNHDTLLTFTLTCYPVLPTSCMRLHSLKDMYVLVQFLVIYAWYLTICLQFSLLRGILTAGDVELQHSLLPGMHSCWHFLLYNLLCKHIFMRWVGKIAVGVHLRFALCSLSILAYQKANNNFIMPHFRRTRMFYTTILHNKHENEYEETCACICVLCVTNAFVRLFSSA